LTQKAQRTWEEYKSTFLHWRWFGNVLIGFDGVEIKPGFLAPLGMTPWQSNGGKEGAIYNISCPDWLFL
jgi:hypothetical protein